MSDESGKGRKPQQQKGVGKKGKKGGWDDGYARKGWQNGNGKGGKWHGGDLEGRVAGRNDYIRSAIVSYTQTKFLF